MSTDRKRPSAATLERRWRAAAAFRCAGLLLAGVSVGASACSSNETPGPSPVPSYGDCEGRAEALSAGMSVASEQGYGFELSQLDPQIPVQSDSPPGNHWTVTVSDPSGAKVTGAALAVNSYMPDHGHSGPAAVGVESIEGSGSYDVTELVFPMPTLFSVSFVLTLPGGEKQTATLMLCLETVSG